MIETDFDAGVYTIKINRPEARNALNSQTRRQLCEALISPPKGTRLVKWIGTREAFCSGQDLTEFGLNANIRSVILNEYKPILDAINSLETPIIAGVEGACAGAGVSLALAADIVVAAKSAFFQVAFARVGLVPDILLTHTLPRLIGTSRAMGMSLTGERIEAAKAENWGMIWKCYPDEHFTEQFESCCEQIASGATFALGKTRTILRETWKHSAADQILRETDAQVLAAESDDFLEGVGAFLEKRLPKFKGD